jgi:hypothetical protein
MATYGCVTVGKDETVLHNGYFNAGNTDGNLCAAFINVSNKLFECQLYFYTVRSIAFDITSFNTRKAQATRNLHLVRSLKYSYSSFANNAQEGAVCPSKHTQFVLWYI